MDKILHGPLTITRNMIENQCFKRSSTLLRRTYSEVIVSGDFNRVDSIKDSQWPCGGSYDGGSGDDDGIGVEPNRRHSEKETVYNFATLRKSLRSCSTH